MRNPSKDIVTKKELSFYRRPGGLERANRHMREAINPFPILGNGYPGFKVVMLRAFLRKAIEKIEKIDGLNNPSKKHPIFPYNIGEESDNEAVLLHTSTLLTQLDVCKHYHVMQVLRKGLCYLGINSPRTHFKMCVS